MNEQLDLGELILDLNHPQKAVREAAFTILVEQGAAAVPELVELFPTIGGSARLYVIRALGEIGHRSASTLLVELVRTQDPEEYVFVSSLAAKALGQIGDLEALMDLIGDRRSGPRRMAATVMGTVGDPRAVPALRQALSHPDTAFQNIAAKALARIGTPEALAAVAVWENR